MNKNIYHPLLRKLILPVADKVMHTNICKYIKLLRKMDKWSQDEIICWQNEKLQEIIKQCYNNVFYYRKIFEERGLTSKDIQTVDDLTKLPTVDKGIIKNNYNAFLASNVREVRTKISSTGGTTGEPFRYHCDWDHWSAIQACNLRSWGFAGYKYGDRVLLFGGSSLLPTRKPNLIDKIRYSVERKYPLSAVHLSKENMEEYTLLIDKIHPQFMYGYPSSFFIFAKYIRKHKKLRFKPKAIFTTAEMLYPYYRNLIEEVFNCPVFDQYGCRDGGIIATECEMHSGLHIAPELSIVEFIRDGHPVSSGEIGEIVVTNLWNYSLPFIRYKTGDLGKPTNRICQCGRSLPLIDSLEGRTTDILTFSNGVSLGGPALTLIFRDLPVNKYQIVQTQEDRVMVNLVKGKTFTSKDLKYVKDVFNAHVGLGVTVDFNFVDEIPLTKSGKLRFIVGLDPS